MSEGDVCRSPAPSPDRFTRRQYWILTVQGALQGVGFRAFVHRLASEEDVGGDVRHTSEGAVIQLHGSGDALQRVRERLATELPSHARLDVCDVFHAGEGAGWIREFRIVEEPAHATPAPGGVMAPGP